MGLETEIATFLVVISIWWIVTLLGGIIYGISKKVGTILILFTFTVIVALILFAISVKGLGILTTGETNWTRIIASGIGGATATSIFRVGKDLGEQARKNFTN